MDRTSFDLLNNIYAPLADRAAALDRTLREAGLSSSRGWYAYHSVKLEGEYVTERFPIPVVTAEGCCDVGFDLDRIFLELQLSREKALALDWSRLPAEAEVYGAEEYLSDFYHPGMELGDLVRRIEESKEVTICIAVEFPNKTATDTLVQAIRQGVACATGKGESHGTVG